MISYKDVTWCGRRKTIRERRDCHDEVKRNSQTNSNEIWITALVCVYHNAHLSWKDNFYFLPTSKFKLMHAPNPPCPRTYCRCQHCHEDHCNQEILTIRFFFLRFWPPKSSCTSTLPQNWDDVIDLKMCSIHNVEWLYPDGPDWHWIFSGIFWNPGHLETLI